MTFPKKKIWSMIMDRIEKNKEIDSSPKLKNKGGQVTRVININSKQSLPANNTNTNIDQNRQVYHSSPSDRSLASKKKSS